MKRIVFTAEAFGFGPISKVLAISENIKNIRKIFFGTGVAYDLAKIHSFDELHYLGHENKKEVLALLNRADLFINVMDFYFSSLVKITGCQYYIVDSLLWFWSAMEEGMNEADIYFCQNFFGGGVKRRIKEFNLKNARLIGPIINNNFELNDKKDQVIINFGGLENPFVKIGESSNYPFIILKNLLPLLRNRFSLILVTGLEKVMQKCRERFSKSEFLEYKMLDQKSMLEELYSSVALFTVPGIQTFYDACDKVPIFCLPPQNSSNVRNLDILVSNGCIKHYLTWSDLYEFDFKKYEEKEESEGVLFVLEKIKCFENSQDDQKLFQERVRVFFKNRDTWKDLIRIQKRAVESLGSNGLETIIAAIEHIIHKEYTEIR